MYSGNKLGNIYNYLFMLLNSTQSYVTYFLKYIYLSKYVIHSWPMFRPEPERFEGHTAKKSTWVDFSWCYKKHAWILWHIYWLNYKGKFECSIVRVWFHSTYKSPPIFQYSNFYHPHCLGVSRYKFIRTKR